MVEYVSHNFTLMVFPASQQYSKLKQKDHAQEDDFLLEMDYENDDDEERNIILNQQT